MIKVNIKKLNKDAYIPKKGSRDSAGYDLYACLGEGKSVIIPPHKNIKIGTGISIALPNGYFGAIFARSGLAAKEGLRPANCVGVADSDYRGEYMIALYNDSDAERVIKHGDRVAQLVILPFLSVDFNETEDLDDTERGSGGFGSTGK